VEWLNEGSVNNDADLSEDFLCYADEASCSTITTQQLYEATLQSDGRFELKDGRELYLIDSEDRRWVPTKRI
jgi:hypothetical protein